MADSQIMELIIDGLTVDGLEDLIKKRVNSDSKVRAQALKRYEYYKKKILQLREMKLRQNVQEKLSTK